MSRRSATGTGVALAIALAASLLGPARAEGIVLPPGFSDEFVAAVSLPTAMAWTPDGRLLVTTQSGRLRVVEEGALVPTPALDYSDRICSNHERGMLGVAVHPEFGEGDNRFVYLYYTRRAPSGCPSAHTNPNAHLTPEAYPANVVARFVLRDDNVIDPATETALLDNIPSIWGTHNSGDLEFASDGSLYISIGDSATGPWMRQLHRMVGKIARLNADGTVPADNPYAGRADADRCNTGPTTAGRYCQEIFAWGLRNPFRITFDPNAPSPRFFINDVGQHSFEEVNVGAAAADYGWDRREGPCEYVSPGVDCSVPTPAGMTDPLFSYPHGPGFRDCAAITGGAFVPEELWPPQYNGIYLFSDYVCGTIFQLETSGPASSTTFASNLGNWTAIDLAFGPDAAFGQALYYATHGNGGQIRKISYAVGNRRPLAAFDAVQDGIASLTYVLDASGSSDPDGDQIAAYEWDLDDGGNADGELVTHEYSAAENRTVTLRVRDEHGLWSQPTSVDIFPGNTPPGPEI
ncbi:MAG: PQQ-dependent sugar dehydrogenase, partial [Dehalococcoidia bacterium]